MAGSPPSPRFYEDPALQRPFWPCDKTRLATLSMGVNPVSAFYHDHLFVPADRADEALEALVDLTKTHGL